MDFKGIGFNHSISAAKSFESLNIRQMAIETRDAELLAVLCRSGELDILELDDELAKLTMVQIANGAGLDLEDYSIYNFKNDHKMKNLIAKVFGGHNSELKLYLLSLGAQVPIKLLDSQPHLVQSIMIRGLSQDRKHLEFLVKQFWYEWIRNSNFDGFLCSVLTSSIAAMNDELQDVIVVLTVVMLLDMPKNGAILLLGASIGSKRSNIMRMLKLPVFTSLSLCQNDPMLLEILKSFQKKLDMMPVQISTRPVALVSSSSARDLLFDLVRGVCICGIDTDTKNVSLETLNIAIWCARLDLYRNCADLDQFTRSIPTIPERLVFPVTKFLINLHNQGFYPDYILMNLFPKLCALKDPYCINEMYKVVKANYLSPEFNDMRMGLIAAHKLWTTDKRVSNELVTAIFQIHQRLKSEYDHKDLDGDQIQPFGLLEISLSNIVADICDNDPFFCGKQLLPLIVPSIAISDRRPKELRTVEQELISNFFKSYVLLCEHDVIDLQTGWESVLKSYWDFNLQSDSVLIQFLKYFKLVMDKLNAVRELSDSEISFKDMIIGCIEKLLVHASETVSQAAYEALSQGMAADTESLLKYLTPESVHGNLHKLEKFLVHKIAAEIKQMSRPVFKGFSIEQGGKRRDNIIALDSNIIDGSNIIANMVQLYVNDSARRTVLAPIILYSRPTTISEALIIELCENIVYTDGIEVIDTINGWIYLFENYLTLKSDIVVTEFCTALVMHVDSLNSPKLICSFLLALTSLLLSASNLQYAIAANLMSKILDFFDNRMDITSYDSVREHSSLCVALLSKISLNTAILSKAIKICLESPDSFVRGYTCAVVAADGLLFDYTVSNFIETCYVHHEWISEGSAIGYATLLGAYHQFKPEKPAVATITKDAYDALGAYIAGKDIPAKAVINSIWIASHCSSHESNFAPLIAKSLSHSLEKGCKAIHATARQAQALLNFNTEKITANTILNEFEIAGYETTSFSMLARLVFGSHRIGRPNIAAILTKTQLLLLMQKLYEKILIMQNNRISRSLAWPIGLIFARLNISEDVTINNLKSGAIVDYSRLSLENSFLRATFDLLQTHIRNGSNDDAQFILRNIIYKIDCTFPVVDWSFLLRVCKTNSDYIDTLTFCLRQCGIGSTKSILDSSLELFNLCLRFSPTQTLSNTLFGRILELGLKEQVFSPTEMKQVISPILILLQKEMINSDWLQILRFKMTQAPKSPQYDAICHELLSYIKNLSGKVKDYKTVRHIQFLMESAWNYSALDQLVSQCEPSDMQESQLWIMASLSLLKPELTDNYINVLDSLAERKLHLHTISYIAMIIPIQIKEIYLLKISSTLKLDQIQTKWISKILNLNHAVSQSNKYLANYYFKFVLLPMLYFMHYPSTEIDFHTIDYDLVPAGGFRQLLRMNLKGTENLLDVIFQE